MSLCKQVRAPARGGGLLGRPWLRVQLNGCRKTKPFQSLPWKRETTVLGMVERERELHLKDRELWFELSYWPEKKDTENMLAKQRANNLRHLRWKGKYAIPECFRLWAVIVLSCAYVFFNSDTPLSDTICHMDNDAHVLVSYILLFLITMDSKHASFQKS